MNTAKRTREFVNAWLVASDERDHFAAALVKIIDDAGANLTRSRKIAEKALKDAEDGIYGDWDE